MVKIRLTRIGAKNSPSYRIVAIDARRSRGSIALEVLGHYNPSQKPASFKVNKERLGYWQSVGAQTSSAVSKLLAGKYNYKKYEGGQKETNPKDSSGVTETTDSPATPPATLEEAKNKVTSAQGGVNI